MSQRKEPSYDMMPALDLRMDLEKLPPNPPQPPDMPNAVRPKPLSTKEQRIEWLVKNPSFLYVDRHTLVCAWKAEGLISKKTYELDVHVEPLILEALSRLRAT